jgi:hypothetical protein
MLKDEVAMVASNIFGTFHFWLLPVASRACVTALTTLYVVPRSQQKVLSLPMKVLRTLSMRVDSLTTSDSEAASTLSQVHCEACNSSRSIQRGQANYVQ